MNRQNIIVLIALSAALSACGSKTKTEEAPAAPAATASTTTPAASTTDAKADSKKMTNKAKAVSTDPNAKEIKCMSGSDERTLANTAKDGGCELIYTKNGEAKTIATQIIGDAKCAEVMANVKANLEGSGFTCQ